VPGAIGSVDTVTVASSPPFPTGGPLCDRRLAATNRNRYRLSSVQSSFNVDGHHLLVRDRNRLRATIRAILPSCLPRPGVTVRHLLKSHDRVWRTTRPVPDSQTMHVSDRDVLALLARKDTPTSHLGVPLSVQHSVYVLLGLNRRARLLPVSRFRNSFPARSHLLLLRAPEHDRVGRARRGSRYGTGAAPRPYGTSPKETPRDYSDRPERTSATLGDRRLYTKRRRSRALGPGAVRRDARRVRSRCASPPQTAHASARCGKRINGFGLFVDPTGRKGAGGHRETSGVFAMYPAVPKPKSPPRRFTGIVLTNRK